MPLKNQLKLKFLNHFFFHKVQNNAYTRYVEDMLIDKSYLFNYIK